MSPPLETHDKTGSIGVDNDISLLASPKIEHDDQALDLFLNQVSDYNAQQLTFGSEQHQASSSSTMGKILFFLYITTVRILNSFFFLEKVWIQQVF